MENDARTLKVLVVEDESIIALDIKMRLQKMGFTVPAVASNGADAIRYIDEIRPDFILLDVRLRGDIDGTQVAKYAHDTSNTPFLFISAHTDKETVERALLFNVQGYLVKPFTDSELAEAIFGLLSQIE